MISLVLLVGAAFATDTWQEPPAPVADLLDAPLPTRVSLSPDPDWMLELERPSLPPLAELAEPVVRVAGLEIDPRTNGPARAWSWTALTLRTVERHNRARRLPIDVPEGTRIRSPSWSPDGRHLAFDEVTDEGIALWVASVDDPTPVRLTEPVLNVAYGRACRWLPGDAGLICKVVPSDRGEVAEAALVPDGPRIDENIGRQAPARTYANLLRGAHDEVLFEHFLTSEVVHVALDGTQTPLLGPALVDEALPSPDGRYLLLETVERPFSRSVPVSRFPRTTVVVELTPGEGVALEPGAVVSIEELDLADAVPITFGSVRTGKRQIRWRPDAPASLWFVEALDGGDAGREADHRDAVSTLEAPFDGEPELLWRSTLRFGGISFAADGAFLASEWWYDDRRTRSWWRAPGQEPTVLWDRSYQDAYSDPGSPLTVRGPHGRSVLQRTEEGHLYLSGRGVSPEGVHPFLDRLDPETGESTRLWQARDPYHETVVDVLEGDRLITRRQSAEEPPNYLLRPLGRGRTVPLTAFPDPAPAFAEVTREVIRYEREDGLPLSATLYLPPGHDTRRDGPLPTLFWVYPNEFRSRDDAGQVTTSSNTFTRPWGSSPLHFLLLGWAVVDNPTIPIVGEGEEQPNDTYVDQLVAGAEAAVAEVVDRGVADPGRLVIGGHSYGAFTTANLLAHSDLFQAGIARSGAYNRSLTPFGFQGEQRSFWEAPEIYHAMSPFSVADRIDQPMLLLHGADDNNTGTWPMQSERLFEAVKGLGGTVRYVELPFEGHGYRARETVGHALWEMITWAERWTEIEAVAEEGE